MKSAFILADKTASEKIWYGSLIRRQGFEYELKNWKAASDTSNISNKSKHLKSHSRTISIPTYKHTHHINTCIKLLVQSGCSCVWLSVPLSSVMCLSNKWIIWSGLTSNARWALEMPNRLWCLNCEMDIFLMLAYQDDPKSQKSTA